MGTPPTRWRKARLVENTWHVQWKPVKNVETNQFLMVEKHVQKFYENLGTCSMEFMVEPFLGTHKFHGQMKTPFWGGTAGTARKLAPSNMGSQIWTWLLQSKTSLRWLKLEPSPGRQVTHTESTSPGDKVTVSCAEGDTGFIYKGELKFESLGTWTPRSKKLLTFSSQLKDVV